MGHQVLARRLRPQKFQDVVGQQAIVRTLVNSLLQSRPGHAYLFSGTRGVGKTTLARILAKAIRCESIQEDGNPCDACESCRDFNIDHSLNVIEIDGASNNSVDNIRDLVSNIQYLPTTGKYKIYIIDEVHMLSTSAFNALLKTLEEPPKHIVFIFATTEFDKVIPTVISRCQCFDFRPIAKQEIASYLSHIEKKEGIKFSNTLVKERLADLANGSMRDALSFLEQVLNYAGNEIIDDHVLFTTLGIPKPEAIHRMANAILQCNASLVADIYRELLAKNIQIRTIISLLLEYFFTIIEEKDATEKPEHSVSTEEIFWIFENIARDATWTLVSINPMITVEVMLRKIALRRTFFREKTIAVAEKPSIENDKKPDPQCLEKKNERSGLAPTKTWDGFIQYLYTISPAQASNIEQGNILCEPTCVNEFMRVEIKFAHSEKVFHDYLNEIEVRERLSAHLAKYYELPSSMIRLDINLIDEEKVKSYNFQSRMKIAQQQMEVDEITRKEHFNAHVMIQEAESLFNSKVDAIQLKKK